jgi:4-hydroxybenzoate polyprenyltransferase
MTRLTSFLELMRPANLVTAVADVLAGACIAFAVGGDAGAGGVVTLSVATIGLYGGGVVFNDVFDADLDRLERPERAIPSGRVRLTEAVLLGGLLLMGGIFLASLVGGAAGALAFGIAVLALVYDARAKHHAVFGPLLMGMCRGGNLLLGVSLSGVALSLYWPLAFIPVLFIAAITLTSRGEVHGNNRGNLKLALGLDVAVLLVQLGLSALAVTEFWDSLPFLAVWFGMNLRAKLRAIRDNRPERIGKAVRAGVLSLIPLNACVAAGFVGWWAGVGVLALLPLSMWLGGRFRVT